MKTYVHAKSYVVDFSECFRQTLQIKSKHTFYVQNFPPPENRDVYQKMWKITVDPGRPQMKIWRTRIAGWIPKDTYSFPTATTVAPQCQFIIKLPLLLVRDSVNLLKTKGINPYRTVNTFHHGYEDNQSMMNTANVAVCSDIHTKHSAQSERYVEFLNVKPGGT